MREAVLMFFIDESGSIPTFISNKWKNRYFVMAFIQTENPKKLKNTYKYAIRNLKKYYPDFFANIDNPNELKGADAHPFMKEYIFRNLIAKTDMKIAHMIVDTWNIEESFRENPCRSFNYLTKVLLCSCYLTHSECVHLELKIDNRNSAIKSLKSLEDYLFNELVLGKSANHASIDIRKVSVEYLDSCTDRGIQIADMVANTLYKYFRYKSAPFPDYRHVDVNSGESPEVLEYLFNLLLPRIKLPFVYPPPFAVSRRQISASVNKTSV